MAFSRLSEKDRWMVGWMDGRVDGWTDNEWTDGLTGELISFLERSVWRLDYGGEAGGGEIS